MKKLGDFVAKFGARRFACSSIDEVVERRLDGDAVHGKRIDLAG